MRERVRRAGVWGGGEGESTCVYVCTYVCVCIWYVCVHIIYVHSFLCVWICVVRIYTQVYTCAPRGQRSMSDKFLNYSLPYLGDNFSLNLILTNSARLANKPQGSFSPSQYWDYRHTLTHSIGAWDLNSCLHACATSRLPIKPCLQPLYFKVWSL